MAIWTMSSMRVSLVMEARTQRITRACIATVQNQSRYGSFGAEGCGASILAVEQRCLVWWQTFAAAVSEFDDAVADASGWQLTCRAGTGRNGKTAPVDAHRHYIQGDVSGTAGVIRAG